jgi:hypothetical protein
MDKEEIVLRVSTLFALAGRGDKARTAYFDDRKHDVLCERLVGFLERHRSLLRYEKVEVAQALNDRGVDVLLTFGEIRVGIQIKSYFDVGEDGFAANVKRQATESLAHGIVKWYLLICCPEEYKTGRVAHLLNELSALQTKYIATYSPRNCIGLFSGDTTVEEDEFSMMLASFTHERGEFEAVLGRVQAALEALSTGAPPPRVHTDIPQIRGERGAPVRHGTSFYQVVPAKEPQFKRRPNLCGHRNQGGQ